MNRIGIIDSSLGSPSIEKSGEKKQWRPVKPLSYGLLCSFLACWIVLSVSCAPRVSQNEIIGIASWYGKDYHGKRTASGEWYNMYKYTAAHPTLPFGTRVEVTNLDTNRRVVVVINDRGPFVKDRIIDVSFAAAKKLELLKTGTARVKLKILN